MSAAASFHSTTDSWRSALAQMWTMAREGAVVITSVEPADGNGKAARIRTLLQIDGDVTTQLSRPDPDPDLWNRHQALVRKRIDWLPKIRTLVPLVRWIWFPVAIACYIREHWSALTSFYSVGWRSFRLPTIDPSDIYSFLLELAPYFISSFSGVIILFVIKLVVRFMPHRIDFGQV